MPAVGSVTLKKPVPSTPLALAVVTTLKASPTTGEKVLSAGAEQAQFDRLP
jgi:hypothetical protein